MSLPAYIDGTARIEAFQILAIELEEHDDAFATLHGLDGIRHVVSGNYLDHHQPYTGGYYVRYPSGSEDFLDADAFEATFKSVG